MARSWGDRGALFIAEGCGFGWSRVAPGTVASLAAVFLAAGLKQAIPEKFVYLGVVALLSAISVPICTRATRVLNSKDPGSVVLDEICAVLLIYTFIPWTWWTAIAGFVLFRILDIGKPWPIRALERLPVGWGIMADDLFAGAVVGAVLAAALRLAA